MSCRSRRRKQVGASSAAEYRPRRAAARLSVLPPGGGLAEILLLLPDLSGRVAGSEICRLENLANLDLSSPVEGSALEPFDRLFLRLHLPKPETGDQLLRLCEGPIGHRPLSSRELDARAF